MDFVPGSVNDFEVFVGGVRLRKNDISVFDPTLDQDSPEADVIANAEFILSGSDLVLTSAPQNGVKIVVVRKLGKMWQDEGVALKDSESNIAKFLRAGISELPE
jgi:hypothetical protein